MKYELHRKYSSKEIGQVVKNARKTLGFTQRSLAFTAGTGLRFIVELEHGKTTCELEKVLIVLKTLGLNLTLEGN